MKRSEVFISGYGSYQYICDDVLRYEVSARVHE